MLTKASLQPPRWKERVAAKFTRDKLIQIQNNTTRILVVCVADDKNAQQVSKFQIGLNAGASGGGGTAAFEYKARESTVSKQVVRPKSKSVIRTVTDITYVTAFASAEEGGFKKKEIGLFNHAVFFKEKKKRKRKVPVKENKEEKKEQNS